MAQPTYTRPAGTPQVSPDPHDDAFERPCPTCRRATHLRAVSFDDERAEEAAADAVLEARLRRLGLILDVVKWSCAVVCLISFGFVVAAGL